MEQKRTTIYLYPDQIDWLRKKAKKEKKKMAHIIRELIEKARKRK